jgi:hypothetical protein
MSKFRSHTWNNFCLSSTKFKIFYLLVSKFEGERMDTLSLFLVGEQVTLKNGRSAAITEDIGLGFRRCHFSMHIDGEEDFGVAHISELCPASVPTVPLQSVSSAGTTGVRGDMSPDVLDSRLGEICLKRLDKFPIAYAWPALVSAAGTMIPLAQPDPGVVMSGDQMTNFFTGLIGPVHSGKSQAISWANQVIGLYPKMYSQVRAASSEALLKKLHNMHKRGELMKSLLIDLDEWQHLFDKAGIEHASFASFLQTAFYKRSQSVMLGGGFEVEISCALTLIGGIVEDQFEECFGARSMGGLHDRFMFGLCPEGNNFLYRPFEGQSESISPIAIRIDKDVWEMVDGLRKANPLIGREAEIAVRVANVCAAFDGRPVLHAKDCEKSVSAFIAEQLKTRDLLRPNDGQTTDAIVSNAILEWLRRNAKVNEVVSERKLRNGIRRTLSRYGMGALKFATDNLARQGIIAYGDIPDSRPYGGRKPKAYELLPEKYGDIS